MQKPTCYFGECPINEDCNIAEQFCVCRLEASVTIPAWASKSAFFTITKTSDELAIVCEQKYAPTEVKAERDFRVLKVLGPLDFCLTGILSSISGPLAEGKISIRMQKCFPN